MPSRLAMFARRCGIAVPALLLSAAALAAPADPPVAESATPRYAVDAHITPAPPSSADGRFQLSASAKLAADGAARYQLKAIAADCSNSIPDPVFKDGFE